MKVKSIDNLFEKYSGEHKEFLEPLSMLTHGEFVEVVNRLKRENKIAEDTKGHLCWIYDPAGVREVLDHPEKHPPVI
jgi:hypothetical protein